MFRAALVLAVLLSIEAISWLAFLATDGALFSSARLQAERAVIIRGDLMQAPDPRKGGAYVVHPYLGFVLDPGYGGAADETGARLPISRLGFLGGDGDLPRRAPGKVVVAIFGGSVAQMLSTSGWDELRAALAAAPRFAGKEIVPFHAAMPGYKQPQQLLQLSYLLGLGAEMDVLIELDGFNEVATYPVESEAGRLFPPFPRGWPMIAQDLPERRPLLGEIVFWKSERRRLARVGQTPALRRCAAFNMAWRLADRAVMRAIERATRRLERVRAAGPSYQALGPDMGQADEQAAMALLVDVWWRSSVAMAGLCKAHGIEYHHFLQPNQYYEGSHPMGDDERRVAFSESAPYRRGARRGYPLLVAAGARIAASGAPYHDLTMLFAASSEPVYGDTCCHLAARGQALLAHAVAEAIAAGP